MKWILPILVVCMIAFAESEFDFSFDESSNSKSDSAQVRKEVANKSDSRVTSQPNNVKKIKVDKTSIGVSKLNSTPKKKEKSQLEKVDLRDLMYVTAIKRLCTKQPELCKGCKECEKIVNLKIKSYEDYVQNAELIKKAKEIYTSLKARKEKKFENNYRFKKLLSLVKRLKEDVFKLTQTQVLGIQNEYVDGGYEYVINNLPRAERMAIDLELVYYTLDCMEKWLVRKNMVLVLKLNKWLEEYVSNLHSEVVKGVVKSFLDEVKGLLAE